MNRLFIHVPTGFDLVEQLDHIKRIGFEGYFSDPYHANLIEEMRAVKQRGDSLGLECETSHSVMEGCASIWSEGDAGDAYISLMQNNIDNCTALSIPMLVVHAKPDITADPSFERGAARLKRLVDYAAAKNVKIAFENINSAEYLFKTLRHFDQPHVGFCYDVGHEACNTPGVRFLPEVGERLFCTHIHDNDLKRDQHKIPFDGSIDFGIVCGELRRCGYRGNITVEVKYDDNYRNDISFEDFLKRAYNAANKLRDMIKG